MITTGFSHEESFATFARGASTLSRETHYSWNDSIQLDNRDATAIVLPATGRIVRFAEHQADEDDDEQNFLFSNRRGNNYGASGSLWPPSRWPRAAVREFDSFDGMPHDFQVVSRCIVESTVDLADFSTRMRRQIALAPHGTKLTITNTLDPLTTKRRSRAGNHKLVNHKLVPWEIAHIPTPTRLAIRVDPSTDLPGGHKLLHNQPWESLRRAGDDILLAHRPSSDDARFGCDGDLFVAEIGEQLAIFRRVDDETRTGRFLAGEAAIVSFAANHFTLEFTGAQQARPTLVVQWDLMPWNPTNTDNELAALVRTL